MPIVDEIIGGGVARDRYGRPVFSVRDKNSAAALSDVQEAGSLVDVDGHQQVVLLDTDGSSLAGAGSKLTAVRSSGSASLLKLTAPVPGSPGFGISLYNAQFGMAHDDPVLMIGYNRGAGLSLTKEVAGQASAHYAIEGDYEKYVSGNSGPTVRTVEMYPEIVSPSGAASWRPFQIYALTFDSSGNPVNTKAGMADTFLIDAPDGGGLVITHTSRSTGFSYGLTEGQMHMYGKTGGDTNITLHSVASQNCGILFGSGTTDNVIKLGADAATQGSIQCRGTVLRFFSINSNGGMALCLNANDNAAGFTLSLAGTGDTTKGLVVRRKSSTAANMVELQDDLSNVLAGADRNGAFFDYVKTSAGAPSSGTWAQGACVLNTSDSKVYWCTAAGSPGTWKSVAIA